MTKYIKLFSQDNSSVILGVEKIDEPMYIKWQEKHKALLLCPEKEAQGILSVNGKSKYQLENKEQIPSGEELLVASFIDEYDYELLYNKIGAPTDDDTESEEETNNNGDDNKVLAYNDLVQKVFELEKTINTAPSGASTVTDEATQKFMATISNSETNSIAKIRAAAQQYLDDTSNFAESEVTE